MFAYPPLPSRHHGRRRDRRGRGMRGPALPLVLPGTRTRAQLFDDIVTTAVAYLEAQFNDAIDGVEFAVEDVPPSIPAPWEHGAVPLGRYFPADLGMAHRIVVYRRPVLARAPDYHSQLELVTQVLIEQVEHLSGGFGDASRT